MSHAHGAEGARHLTGPLTAASHPATTHVDSLCTVVGCSSSQSTASLALRSPVGGRTARGPEYALHEPLCNLVNPEHARKQAAYYPGTSACPRSVRTFSDPIVRSRDRPRKKTAGFLGKIARNEDIAPILLLSLCDFTYVPERNGLAYRVFFGKTCFDHPKNGGEN